MLAKHADRNLTVGHWRVRCSNGYAFISKIQTRVGQLRRQSIVLAISAILSAGFSAARAGSGGGAAGAATRPIPGGRVWNLLSRPIMEVR